MSTISAQDQYRSTVDRTPYFTVERPPQVIGGNDFTTVTDKVCRVNEGKTPLGWWVAFVISASFLGLFGLLLGYLFLTGVGVWGNNIPCAWAFDITNFVFWVG